MQSQRFVVMNGSILREVFHVEQWLIVSVEPATAAAVPGIYARREDIKTR